jgi:hypothetical protein
MFICYHHCCGIKVMLMLCSSIAAVLFVLLIILPVIGLGRRNILLVAYFISFHVYGCFGAKNYLWSGGVILDRA